MEVDRGLMGEVIDFRRKKLSGFIPEGKLGDTADAMMVGMLPTFAIDLAEPIVDMDVLPSETNPDSGDCV
jgi:hypothetical protein